MSKPAIMLLALAVAVIALVAPARAAPSPSPSPAWKPYRYFSLTKYPAGTNATQQASIDNDITLNCTQYFVRGIFGYDLGLTGLYGSLTNYTNFDTAKILDFNDPQSYLNFQACQSLDPRRAALLKSTKVKANIDLTGAKVGDFTSGYLTQVYLYQIAGTPSAVATAVSSIASSWKSLEATKSTLSKLEVNTFSGPDLPAVDVATNVTNNLQYAGYTTFANQANLKSYWSGLTGSLASKFTPITSKVAATYLVQFKPTVLKRAKSRRAML